MNRRQVILLALGVILAHAALFWLISGTRPLPKANYIAPPNFFARQATWDDKETGEHLVVHEYQVSTRLSLPDVLMQRRDPDPDSAPASSSAPSDPGQGHLEPFPFQ